MMENMEIIKIKDEYIKLGQALKLAGFVESGLEAKEAVNDGSVKVNGETELRRGRKLYHGDIVEYGRDKLKVNAGGSI